MSRTQVQAEAAAFAAVFLWPRRLHWRARPRSLTYPGYTNTGLRLGQYSKSAGNGGMAFVADNLRTGVYGNSTPILSIHSTAAAGAGGRRTALDFMGNGEGWRFFSAPDGTGAPLQLRHITGGVVGNPLWEYRNDGRTIVKNGTFNSVYLGNDTGRSNTTCTQCLNLFDGTAPVDTLANGVSLYSAAGEMRSMDASGNSTLLSPQDTRTNEWVFYSKNTVTGQVLKIDMERLVKALNDYFGWDYVHQWVEMAGPQRPTKELP